MTNLPNTVKLPNNTRCATRISKAEYKISSKGNPMIVLDVEIFNPESIKINGTDYNIAGIVDKHFLTLTDAAMQRVKEFMKHIGIGGVELDKENPDTDQFIGRKFSALWGGDEYVYRAELTDEDRAAGKTEGEPVTDEEGNVLRGYRSKMKMVIGPTKF